MTGRGVSYAIGRLDDEREEELGVREVGVEVGD